MLGNCQSHIDGLLASVWRISFKKAEECCLH